METITFTATFTFSKESVIGFAQFLGYQSKIQQQRVLEDGSYSYSEIDNPETVFDFLARLAKEHNEKFTTVWAEYLVQQEISKQVDILKPQFDAQIIQPVKDSIQVTYQENV